MLNENAEIGSKGNKRTIHITCSNDPNDEQGGDIFTGTISVYTLEANAIKNWQRYLESWNWHIDYLTKEQVTHSY